MSPPVRDTVPQGRVPGPTNTMASISRRRRAARACRMCKTRKVRCDRHVRNGCCTNCQLDGYTCVVDERRVRRESNQRTTPILRLDDASGTEDMGVSRHAHFQVDALEMMDSQSDKANSDHSELALDPAAHLTLGTVDEFIWEPPTLSNVPDLPPSNSESIRHDTTSNLADGELLGDLDCRLIGFGDDMFDAAMDLQPENHSARSRARPPHAVNPGNRSHLSQKEIDFLDSENTFDLPSPPALDEFVRAFFLIVHPNLLVIDEARFWRAYTGHDQHARLSLFALNAMLCVSSGFVSSETICRAGFENSRQAGATFYHRAKLLYDFGVEDDQIQIANGALLLSHYTSSYKNPQTVRNTSWLNIAAEVARSTKTKRHFRNSNTPESQKREYLRLLWCCVARDRFLAVGTRRHHKVHTIPDLDTLRTDTFEGDYSPDNVYDRETSKRFTQLFVSQCRLALALTAVAEEICMPGVPPPSEREALASFHRIESAHVSLKQWFEESVAQFPAPSAISLPNRYLALCVNSMYLRYYAAKLALAHREILVLHSGYQSQMLQAEAMQRQACEIEVCVDCVRELVKELVLLDLTRYLCFGTILNTAFPLILHQLDLKLAASAAQRSQRESRLKVFTKIMDSMRQSYSGSDGVDNVIHLMQDGIETEPSILDLYAEASDTQGRDQTSVRMVSPNPIDTGHLTLTQPRPRTLGWPAILLRRPRFYFKLVLSLEISLSQGFSAQPDDIPPLLQAFHFG